MSLFDRAINVASDVAKSSMANYQRSVRRRAAEEQIAYQHAVIQWATARIGRLALQAVPGGRPLPDTVRPAAAAIRGWEAEVVQLQQQVAALDAQAAAAAQQAAQAAGGGPPVTPPGGYRPGYPPPGSPQPRP